MSALLWLVGVAGATPDDARDLTVMLDTIERRYAYLDPAITDLAAVRQALTPEAHAADTPDERVRVLERALESLVDAHATLGTNLPSSARLVPTGIDVWATLDGDEAVITAVRSGWPADRAGLAVGDRIVAIDGALVGAAVAARIPLGAHPEAPRVREWTLLTLLAGTHDRDRVWRLADGREVTLDDPDDEPAPPGVEWSLEADGSAVVAVRALGDDRTVAAFDEALASVHGASALVLDLRETAGGGNTSVAEPLLGRFVSERVPYQRIVEHSGRAHLRWARPRGEQWTAPVTVLVGRWTGSMGEGLAIGFDATGAGTVAGGPMAGLRGAVQTFTLPASGIRWSLPVQRLTHVDGTPREAWITR